MVFEVHAVLVVNQPYLIAPISKLVNSSNPTYDIPEEARDIVGLSKWK